MEKSESSPWWSERYAFFGEFYMEGDDSTEGYLIEEKQSLRERTETEVQGIEWLLHLKRGEHVLDIPCGYGRHSIGLAERGFTVIGSDINATHLKRAKANAKKAGVEVMFKKENMAEIGYANEFNAVINMFYSFGFFETDEENFRVLQHFYDALVPGGKFLMHTDVNIPRILADKYKEDETRTLASGKSLRIRDVYDARTKRIQGSWEITNADGSKNRKDYSVRVYTREEFEDLCLRAGFKHCKTYSSWSGEPYNESSEDMMVVAEK